MYVIEKAQCVGLVMCRMMSSVVVMCRMMSSVEHTCLAGILQCPCFLFKACDQCLHRRTMALTCTNDNHLSMVPKVLCLCQPVHIDVMNRFNMYLYM